MSKKKAVEAITVTKTQRLGVRAVLFFAQAFILLVGCFYRDTVPLGESIKNFFMFPYYGGGVGFIEDTITSDGSELLKRISIAAIYVLLFCVTSVVVERFYHSARHGQLFAVGVLAAVFIASPAASAFLLEPLTMSRADTVVLAFALLTALFAEKDKLYLLTPLCVLICALFQQAFVWTYLPLAFFPLLYHRGRSSDGKVVLALNALIVLTAFFLDRSLDYSIHNITAERLIQLLVGAILALPVFWVTFTVWRRAAHKGRNNAYLYRFCMLSVLLPLPLLLTRSCFEVGRLVSAAVTTQLALLFLLVSAREKAVCPAFNDVCESIEKHAVFALTLVGVYAAMLRMNEYFLGFIGRALYRYIPF